MRNLVNQKIAAKLNETQTQLGPQGAKVITIVKNGRVFVKQASWKDTKLQNQKLGDLALRHGLTFPQCLDVLAGQVASVRIKKPNS